MRRTLTIAALAAGGLLAAGAAAPAALAADDCPNAAVRAQQGVSHLPNCYAYEKITPNNKNGRIVGAEYLVSDDGTQLWMYANAPITDTVSGNVQTLLATRGAEGWGLEPLTNSPLFGNVRNTGPVDYLMLWQPIGMRGVLFSTPAQYDADDVGGGPAMAVPDIYRREQDGSYTWITRPVGFNHTVGQPLAGGATFLRSNEDATEILFSLGRVLDPAIEGDTVDRNHLWIWREGQPSVLVDRMPDGSPSTTTYTGADRHWSTPDLGTIVWDTSAGTTNLNRTRQLWARVGAGTPQARTVKVTASHDGTGECTGTRGNAGTFRYVSVDGRYVGFSCGVQLHPDAPATGIAQYVRDLQTGTLHLITSSDQDAAFGNPNYQTGSSGWERPDGTFRLESRGGVLWTVDLRTNEETCHTCALKAEFPSASTHVSGGVSGLAAGGLGPRDRVNYVTPEGYVFFTTAAPAVPEDVNGTTDLYLSDGERYYLISGGDVSTPLEMGGIASDGSTVSFKSTSSLLADDRDGEVADVYVLRKNGGYYREPVAAECSSNCQGSATIPPGPVVPPLSVHFPAADAVVDETLDPIAISGSRSVTGTSIKVKVRVPGGGRATVTGSGLRSVSRSVGKASTLTLTVKLSSNAQRTLRRKGTVKTRATVRFVPESGDAQTKRVSLTFKKKKATKKRASSRGAVSASNGKAAR